jgi:hypothetical protein
LPYRARRTLATAADKAPGNLAIVINVMGHPDVRPSMRHPLKALDPVREAIDPRNTVTIQVTVHGGCSENGCK